MIIFDGCDLAGKTTMARAAVAALQEAGFPHMYMHLDRLPNNGAWDYYRGYTDLMSAFTVWDRFHLSELAYRSQDDRPTGMTPAHYELVDAALTMVGGFVVVVVAHPDVIKVRHAKRKEDMYKLDHILKVNEWYTGLVNSNLASLCECRGVSYRPKVHYVICVDRDDFDVAPELTRLIEAYVTRFTNILEISRS
jgi:thymidylate kinase